MLVHPEVGVYRHGDQVLEHVRSRFGARQDGIVAQQFGGLMQVAFTDVLQVKTHQVDQAVFGFLQVGAQKLVAEVARNLHHTFGRIGAQGVEFLLVDQPVLHAIDQYLLEKWAGVIE